jgi:hypothetical protein
VTWQLQTGARLAPCGRCRRHILTAVTGGLARRADPVNLTLGAEITARLSGRDIYDVLIYGLPRRLYLEYRDITRVKAGRANAIVASHECPPGKPGPPGTQITVPIRKGQTDAIPY